MKFGGTDFIISFFLLLFAQTAMAHSYAPVDLAVESQDLTPSLSYSWQSPEEQAFENFNYVDINGKDLNAKYSDKALWLRLNLQNPGDLPSLKILYFTTFLVGQVWLFEPGQKSPEQVSGSAITISERSFPSRLPAFKVSFSPHEQKTFYIKRMSHHSLSTRIRLADQATFLIYEADAKTTLFFYAGGIFCLIVFNLFTGLYTHDKDFLFYSLFAGTVAVTVLVLHGVLDCYTFTNFHSTLAQYLMCFSAMSVISSLIFANRFFNLTLYFPQAKKLFKAIGSVALFLLLYGFFFNSTHYWPYMGYVTDFLLNFTLLTLIAIAFVVLKRGSKTAQFFLISWAFMAAGVVAYFGVLYGFLPNVPIFYNGLLYGNLSEMLMISLGLAYKLNVLDLEKRQALKEASEKDHYHRLVKVLSHDVSNASFIFSSYITRLKKRISDPQGEVVVEKIESTLSKMNQILDSVRNEQAFKSFQQSVGLVKVNLNEVVRDVLHFYEERFESKELNIEVEISPEVYVLADRSALANQVISNIVSNSVKFSKSNGTISIRLSESDKDYRLAIEDHGIGIPKDQIAKIFFADNLISTQGTNFEKGSGLGCSLVREYMKLFNGSLEVESRTAQGIVSSADFLTGTKVTLVFPRLN